MSIYFLSSAPQPLLASFNEEIRNQKIDTWRRIQKPEGDFYTHTSSQWKDRAILNPDDTKHDRLTFYVKRFQGKELSPEVFEYYQAHLQETFFRHFYPDQFSEVQATPSPTGEDDSF